MSQREDEAYNPFLTPPAAAQRTAPPASSRGPPPTAPPAHAGAGFSDYAFADDAKSSKKKFWKGVFSSKKALVNGDPAAAAGGYAGHAARGSGDLDARGASQPSGGPLPAKAVSTPSLGAAGVRPPAAAPLPPSAAPKPSPRAHVRASTHVAAEAAAAPPPPAFDPQASLPAFYEEVSSLKEQLAAIAEQKGAMEALHDTAKKLTKTAELQAAQADMGDLVKSIKKGLADTNKRVQALQKRNERDYLEAVDAIDVEGEVAEVEAARDRLTSIFQMRAQVTIGLVAKFNKTCDAFKQFEARVAAEYHEDVKRRLQTVNGTPAEDDYVEDLIDNGQAESVFKQALLQTRGQAILEFSREVQERHEGMQKLYKDLLELHQMMLDFSVLVFEQGKMIDNIADQVSGTAEFIRKGTDQLLRAKAHKKTAAKFKSAAALTATGVAAAGVGYVALTAAGLAAPLAM